MVSITCLNHAANRQAVYYEELLTHALHYIARNDGSLLDFLDECSMIEDWEDWGCDEFFGFVDYESKWEE